MPVNHEIKSQLAKLLATEDLVVEHKKCSTAQFNVHTRVLTLPMWEKASETVYDMLVSHEVGHALYTPDEDWTEQVKVPPQFVNIVEDARIEKLMKRRYGGLNKVFYNAYKELNDEDFFSIKDDDLTTFNLADRANLWFKIGSYINVPIQREEMGIINMIADAETFEDALNAAVALYEYCKQENHQQDKFDITIGNEQSMSGSGSEQQENNSDDGDNDSDSINSEENQSQDTGNQESESKSVSDQGGETADPQVKTADALDEAIQELIDNAGDENVYIELPKLNLDTVIAKNSDIYDYINSFWKSHLGPVEEHQRFYWSDNNYIKFKKDSQKEVNYLVKEFECRKAADSYARASVSRTGVLDCTKLHTYKYNEDLFRKVTTFADGKNHGLVFILDWSGSMANVLIDTLKQMYNIIWFCRKVNIPFEVYAFTNEWNGFAYDENNKPVYPQDHYQKKEYLVSVERSFSLMNLFTSKVNNKKLDEQMQTVFRLANAFNYYSSASLYPPKLSLSGTPLNESLVALHQIIPQFKADNKVQKVQCIVLTDGEAAPLTYHFEVQRHWEVEPYLGVRRIYGNVFLRNRKTGMTYKIEDAHHTSFTKTFLCNLKDSFIDVNFIGIRIVGSRDATSFIRNNTNDDDFEKTMNVWKKERSIALSESGYHRYFGMSSTALSNEIEFRVEPDAPKTAIRNAFKKSLNSKKMNKKFLNEFIKLVA